MAYVIFYTMAFHLKTFTASPVNDDQKQQVFDGGKLLMPNNVFC